MKKSSKAVEYIIYLIVIGSCLLIIFLTGYIASAPRDARTLSEMWAVSFEGHDLGERKSPVYFSGETEDFFRGVYTFDYSLRLEPEYLRGLKNPAIVFPGISGNGFRLSINGRTVGMKGDLVSGRASIWNFPYVFSLPESLPEQENSIRVELYSLYEVGLIKTPYIVDAGDPVRFRFLVINSTVNMMLYLIGGMLTLSFVFVVVGMIGEKRDLQKIYLGLALFFISIFFLDYSYFDSTAIRYLYFKKMAISSQFIALLFFILFVTEVASVERSRFSMFFSAFMICLAVTTIVYPGDMVNFRKFYRIAYLSNISLFIFLMYIYIRKIKHSFELITIFSGGFTALIFALHDVICLFAARGRIFYSHYGLSVLFLSGASVMIAQIINIYVESVKQSSRAEQFYAESMRDPLTGVYNRKILPALEGGITGDYSVVLFDLDDFKMINDSHGHGAGDLALKAFTKLINSFIRSNDYTIRIGGDEFLTVLPGCGYKTAGEQGEKICRAAASLELVYKGSYFNIGATMGIASGGRERPLTDTIEEADLRMYAAKQRRDGELRG